MKRLVHAAAVALVCALTACNGNPIGPSSGLVGVWSGPVTDDTHGEGTLTMTVVDVSPNTEHLTGGWSWSFASGHADAGCLSVFFTGTQPSLTLRPIECGVVGGGPAPFVILATPEVGRGRLAGTYTRISEEPPVRHGSFELARK